MNEYSLIQSQTLRKLHFFLRIFDEFFSGFRAKFQKIVTCVAFSTKFAKTNQNFAENSFVKIIHYYSKLFTGVLRSSATTCRRRAPRRGSGSSSSSRAESAATVAPFGECTTHHGLIDALLVNFLNELPTAVGGTDPFFSAATHQENE